MKSGWVLQVLPDAGQMMRGCDAVPASAARSPTPDSKSNCGVWNAPEERITFAAGAPFVL